MTSTLEREACMTATCSYRGCISIRDYAPRRPGEDPGLCARHRQEDRVRQGACLNCGAPLLSAYEMNDLTGRPLVRRECYSSSSRAPRTVGTSAPPAAALEAFPPH